MLKQYEVETQNVNDKGNELYTVEERKGRST